MNHLVYEIQMKTITPGYLQQLTYHINTTKQGRTQGGGGDGVSEHPLS